MLGYKGVQQDFWSNTGNADTIVVQGQTNDRHQIYNGVGETIEIQRRSCDDNKDNHCSHGLHIGSYDYANNWAGSQGRLLLVEFDPQDAVSVPTDCEFQKLRVSKYKVVADITDSRQELDKVVYEANKPIYGSDSDYEHDDSEVEGEWDDEPFDDSEDAVSRLSVRNYIENKMENGEEVTLKHIADLKVSREEGWRVRDIAILLGDMGFDIEEDEDKIMSNWRVLEL